jgi:hypothetical protein
MTEMTSASGPGAKEEDEAVEQALLRSSRRLFSTALPSPPPHETKREGSKRTSDSTTRDHSILSGAESGVEVASRVSTPASIASVTTPIKHHTATGEQYVAPGQHGRIPMMADEENSGHHADSTQRAAESNRQTASSSMYGEEDADLSALSQALNGARTDTATVSRVPLSNVAHRTYKYTDLCKRLPAPLLISRTFLSP